MPPTEFRILEISNYIFFAAFFLEMVLKMLGLGVKNYLRDKFNQFDAVIVLISTVEVIISMTNLYNNSKSTLSVFRGFRILRLLKLIKSWEKLQELLSTIANTLKDIRNFSVVLFVCIFTYTVLGMEFFAYRIKFNDNNEVDMDGESPRMNFNTFVIAFTSIFNILHGEDWQLVMYDAVRSTGLGAVVFFVTLVIFGQIILINLFLAVLLENFEEKRKQMEEEKKESGIQNVSSLRDKIKEGVMGFLRKFGFCKLRAKKYEATTTIAERQKFYTQDNSQVQKEIEGKSLYLFEKENRFRFWVAKLVLSSKFEYGILIFIIISSVLLSIESPLDDPNS